jgi:hypothetical protein
LRASRRGKAQYHNINEIIGLVVLCQTNVKLVILKIQLWVILVYDIENLIRHGDGFFGAAMFPVCSICDLLNFFVFIHEA